MCADSHAHKIAIHSLKQHVVLIGGLMDKQSYIGVMSGTSCDGLDIALITVQGKQVHCQHTQGVVMPPKLTQAIQQLIQSQQVGLVALCELHVAIAQYYAEAIQQFCKQYEIELQSVSAIGMHGQTVCHHPDSATPFSLQLGNPHVLSARLARPVVADFRNKDIALGGQGAPLAPILHQTLLADYAGVGGVINIGGIANITVLATSASKTQQTIGFDVGPGNTLMDLWAKRHLGQTFDKNGQWAASGQVITDLLASLLADPYFAKSAPKSTGREYFNLDWLMSYLQACRDHTHFKPEDVQATLLMLTVQTLSQTLQKYVERGQKILICGGGVHNQDLMQHLAAHNQGYVIDSIAKYNLDPDFLEAELIAYLTHLRLHADAVDLSSITGAIQPVMLGVLYI